MSQYGGAPSAGPLNFGAVETEPLVYLGIKTTPATGTGDDFDMLRSGTESTEKILTLTQALNRYDRMSLTEQRNMLRLLALGGFAAGYAGPIPPEEIDEFVRNSSQSVARLAYENLLDTASDFYMNYQRPVTPEDVLRSHIAYRLEGLGVDWDGDLGTFDDGMPDNILKEIKDAAAEASGLPGVGEPPKPMTRTETTTQIDLLNPQDAKALTRSMLQAELGRDPTQAEYEDFLSTLHAAERANPATQTTTTKWKLDANDSLHPAKTNTVTNQGIGEAGLMQVAYEKAQSNPDWAEWQAMGTYFPALLQALGATVPGA